MTLLTPQPSTAAAGATYPTHLAFHIDLNAVVDDNRVSTLLIHAVDPMEAQFFPPREGDLVTVRDDDEGLGEAVVVRCRGAIVDLAIDWDSWRTENAVRTDEPIPQRPSDAGLTLDIRAPKSGVDARVA